MGKWKALDLIQPSINETKDLLFPLKIKMWLKLVIVVILGWTSGSGLGTFAPQGGNFDDQNQDETDLLRSDFGGILSLSQGEETLIIAAVILIFCLIFVLAMAVIIFIKSNFTFVFLQAAITKEVNILKSLSENYKLGCSLFYFIFGLQLAYLAAIFILAVPLILNFLKGETGLLSVFVILPVIAILTLAYSLIHILTLDIAVPKMYIQDIGVLKALSETAALIKKDAWQFVLFVLLKTALLVGTGLLYMLVVLIVLVFPVALMAIIVAAILSVSVTLGIIAAIFLVLVSLLLLILILILYLPVPVFFRFYSLMFAMSLEESKDSTAEATQAAKPSA